MLTNQALSEVLQLVASQLFTPQAVVLACFAPVTKNRKLALVGVARAPLGRRIGTVRGTEIAASFRCGR
jgi:hypothetical protein